MISLAAVEGMRQADVPGLWDALGALRDGEQYLFRRVQTGTATLVNGRAVIPCDAVKAGNGSKIVTTLSALSGTPGYIYCPYVSRSPGVSFTVLSSSITDFSTFDWVLVNP
jgi:hypothetical protein